MRAFSLLALLSAVLSVIVPLGALAALTSLTASDPDNLDAVFSSGDVLTLGFDPARSAPFPAVGSPAELYSVVRFSQSIGANHTAAWSPSGTSLVVTVVDASGHGVADLFGPTNAPLPPRLTASEMSGADGSVVSVTPPMAGGFGTAGGPALRSVAYAGSLLRNGSTATATLTFGEPTSMPGPANGTRWSEIVDFRVDRNGGYDRTRLSLRAALVRVRSGTWTSASVLRLEIETYEDSENKITAGSLFPVILGYVRDAAGVKRYGTFDPAVREEVSSLVLSGRFENEKTSVVVDKSEDPELFMMLVVAFGGLAICVLCGGGCAVAIRRKQKRAAGSTDEALPVLGGGTRGGIPAIAPGKSVQPDNAADGDGLSYVMPRTIAPKKKSDGGQTSFMPPPQPAGTSDHHHPQQQQRKKKKRSERDPEMEKEVVVVVDDYERENGDGGWGDADNDWVDRDRDVGGYGDRVSDGWSDRGSREYGEYEDQGYSSWA